MEYLQVIKNRKVIFDSFYKLKIFFFKVFAGVWHCGSDEDDEL
jgi:hypothetical protein